MLDDRVALFMFVERYDKATDVSMWNVKEFINFEAKFEKDLILSFEHLLFHVIVLTGVELQLLNGANTFIHLEIA